MLEAASVVKYLCDLALQALEQIGAPTGLVLLQVFLVVADCALWCRYQVIAVCCITFDDFAWHGPVLLIISLDQNILFLH